MVNYNTMSDTFEYRDGAVEITFTIRIDRNKLGRLIWRAAKNKNGKSINGCLKIEAKVLRGSQAAD